MNRESFEMNEAAELLTTVAHYRDLVNHFPQLSEGAKQFWHKILGGNEIMQYGQLQQWYKIDIHHFSQLWGSTGCGWGGIGAASMCYSYTTVIENRCFNFACVYYNTRLAYICKMDDEYFNTISNGNYDRLPGLQSCEMLTIIHKYTK